MIIETLVNHSFEPLIENGTARIGHGTLLSDVECLGPVSIGDRCSVRRTQLGRYFATGNYCQITDCQIGSFCSFGDNIILNAGNHPKNWLTTHLFATNPNFWNWVKEYSTAPKSKLSFVWRRPSKIGNDVCISNNVVVLTGITIGDGVLIGANSVVTEDVPPYCVVAGVPATIKSKRFDENTIQRLRNSKWWDNPIEILLGLPLNDVQRTLQMLEENAISKGIGSS